MMHFVVAFTLLFLLVACGAESDNTPNQPTGCDVLLNPGGDDQTTVQTALIETPEGSTICFASGTFRFAKEISLSTNNVVVKGAGKDSTVLDFTEQVDGANGFSITGDNVTIESLTVLNTPGDGIRATAIKNIAFQNMAVIWEAESSTDNGAYGLYPVESDGVLIENCVVVGSRDAGIYVGQSKHILVKDCEVYGNVAGIEIENSQDAEVVGNYAHHNTAGILVFDLPELPTKHGQRTKVHKNDIIDNNLPSFAEPGTIVGKVPPGAGVIILSSDHNEVFDNQISGNNSFGVMVLAYDTDLFGDYDDDEFDRFAEGNYVHGNTMENNGTDPQGVIKAFPLPNPMPHLAWGGCVDEEKDNSDGTLTNCFTDNGDVDFVNFDLCGGFANQSTDITELDCAHEPLANQTGRI